MVPNEASEQFISCICAKLAYRFEQFASFQSRGERPFKESLSVFYRGLTGVGRFCRSNRHGNVSHERQALLFRFVDRREVRIPGHAAVDFDEIDAGLLQRADHAAGFIRIAGHHLILIELLSIENWASTQNAWTNQNSSHNLRAPIIKFTKTPA